MRLSPRNNDDRLVDLVEDITCFARIELVNGVIQVLNIGLS